MSLPLRARLACAVIAAVAVAGCSYVNPITTQENYAAGDGLQVEVGDVRGLNLMVISPGAGEQAVLVGTLVNNGIDDAVVSIALDAATVTDVPVAAGTHVFLGPEAGQLLVTGQPEAQPGLLARVTFATDAQGTVTRELQVFDGTLPEYAGLVDGIVAPTASA